MAIDDVIHEPDAEACLVVRWRRAKCTRSSSSRPWKSHWRAMRPGRTRVSTRSVLTDAIRGNHHSLGEQNPPDRGWIIMDNSELNVEQTVDAILESVLRDIINFRRLSDQPDHRRPADRGATGACGRGRRRGRDQPGRLDPLTLCRTSAARSGRWA